MEAEDRKIVVFVVTVIACAAVLIGGCFWIYPMYNVWSQGLAGQGELKRAESNRRIAIQEAEAKKEAAAMLAQAEIERAKGVAEANRIIGSSLHENQDYLRYLWIQELAAAGHVIYVPTEANLPMFLEAGRSTQGPPRPAEVPK